MGRKAKPDLYFFNKFVRELMEEDAEIKIYGNSYQSSNKNLTIKSLVDEICEFEKELDKDKVTKLEDVTRKTMGLKKENSVVGSVEKEQKRIFRQLDFYFGKKNGEKKEPRIDLNHFFLDQRGHVLELFPQLPNKVNKGIEWAATRKSIIELLDLIPALTDKGGPFRKLFDKIRFTAPLEDETFQKKLQHGFETVWQEYQRVYIDQAKETNIGPLYVVIPGYVSPIQSPFAGLNREKETNLDVESEKLFADHKKWFDDLRYERLKALRPKLLNNDVSNWPKWSIEHIILSELEYQYFYWEIWHQVLELLQNNLRFAAYFSHRKEIIDVDKRITNIHELGEDLIKYNIPGQFEDHINLQRGTIINGNFTRYPYRLSAQNIHDPYQMNLEIVKNIAKECFQKLYNSIGLDRNNWTADSDKFIEMAYQVLNR